MKPRGGITRALAALRRAEAELEHHLHLVANAIAALTRPASPTPRSDTHTLPRRRLSPKGREAISRAARRRWTKWRQEHAR